MKRWDQIWVRCLAAALCAGCAVSPAQTPKPAPAPPAPRTPAAPPPRFVVVLDAAHGGEDPGGRLSDGTQEKDAVLALSVRLRSLLGARGIQVVTTRESDSTLGADERAQIANRAGAQACISLHTTEIGTGMHIFLSSMAPAQPGRISAWKTAQANWVARSLAMAGVVNAALKQASFKVLLGRTSLPGLDSMTCPALAIELAPERNASNTATAEPDNPAYQARAANALAAALLAWRSEAQKP